MAILLSWKTANVAENQIKVYRSDAGPVDSKKLPEPIATLTGNVKEYEDLTAIGGKTYNYLIEVTDGKTRLFTATPSVIHIRTRGPGSSLLLQGDHDCGYYGTVDLMELPNMYSAFKHTSSNIIDQNLAPSKWHKFAWKGRVLYIADRQMAGATLTDADCLRYLRSGLKYNFESENFKNDIPNIHSRNGYSFHARSIRGTPEDWDGVLPSNHPDVVENIETEVNQLLACLWPVSPMVKRRLHGIENTNFSSIYTVALADPHAAEINSSWSARNNLKATRFHKPGDPETYTTSLAHGELQYMSDPKLDPRVYGWFAAGNNISYGIPWPVFELIEGGEDEN